MEKTKRVIITLPEGEHAEIKIKAAKSSLTIRDVGAILFAEWLSGRIMITRDSKVIEARKK